MERVKTNDAPLLSVRVHSTKFGAELGVKKAMTIETGKLHDATLLSVTIRWGNSACAEVEVSGSGSEPLALRCHGVSSVYCPQENSWGPSVYIYEVRGPYDFENGKRKIEFAMQSGDTIEVVASAFEWVTSSRRSMPSDSSDEK